MSDAILDQEQVETMQYAGVRTIAVVLIASIGMVLAGLLWWRFGDAVFAASMMSAFMACF